MGSVGNYRFRLGIRRVLMPGIVAIGVTLNSGVVNCNFFELPPVFRFNIVVVDVVVSKRFCSIFNSIKSVALSDIAAAPSDVDVDGADLLPDEFVLIAIV